MNKNNLPGFFSPKTKQSRLLLWAALFNFVYSVCLTLSPAVRLRSWDVNYRWEHWIGFGVWLIGFQFLDRVITKHLPHRDPYLLPVISMLSGIGVLTIWRLNSTFGLRQSIWLFICVLIFWLISRSKTLLHFLRRYKYIWLMCGLVLTILTFFFGTYPAGDGPRLWLGCCGIYFQPSEPLKLLLIIYLSAYLADKPFDTQKHFRLVLPSILLCSTAFLILIAQHDIGTASIFIAIYFSMFYLATGKRRVLLISAVLILLAGILGYLFYGLVQARIDSWLTPWHDPLGKSYQIIQALLSIASGGVFGHGPGLGVPGVVPVAHSDFIYAAISEELGLMGGIALLLLYCLLIYRGLLISIQSKNKYQVYIASGISIFFAVQALLIIGGNIRGLPLTGVTLPFVSYGGSSLLTSFISVGILLIISNQIDSQHMSERYIIPHLTIAGSILAVFVVFSLIHGYWAVIVSDSILARADNPRNLIFDRYNLRGSILDRNNNIITETTGEPGNYVRTLNHPAMSIVNGYAQEVYGKSGLEKSLDEYLRGIKGNPSINTTYEELLYGQPINGLDVRLSIDLKIQEFIDDLLGDEKGSIIILNANSGEVLGLATHPYFDYTSHDNNFNELLTSKEGLLLNRATKGQYLPGSALGPFILSAVLQNSTLPDLPKSLALNTNNEVVTCALSPQDDSDWADLIMSGCPGAINQLALQLENDQLHELYQNIGLFESPQIKLPTAAPSSIEDDYNYSTSAFNNLYISPLQMSLAAAALSSGGTLPSPIIATAINNPNQGWIILPNEDSLKSFSGSAVERSTTLLSTPDYPAWMTISHTEMVNGYISWAIGGTATNYTGTPLSIVVALEKDDPEEASRMINEIFKKLLVP